MKRKVKTKVKGFRTTDGAGVKLVRVLGNLTTKEFDPILMLDSFDSINPDDYTAGFPMHPHRGSKRSVMYREVRWFIETVLGMKRVFQTEKFSG